MIDFQKLIPQISELLTSVSVEAGEEGKILSLACRSFEEASASFERFDKVLRENTSNTYWPLSLSLEPFGQVSQIDELKDPHTIVACDGSQIMPTQHEVASCFLVNVGTAVLRYGRSRSEAKLSSSPHLFHQQDDIYPLLNKRRMHIDETLLSFKRGLIELEAAFELACSEKSPGQKVLVLIDGSLIPFNLNRQEDKFQTELLEQYNEKLDDFRKEEIPILGYISHSRSSEIVNTLRVWRCPYERSHCNSFCSHLNEEDFPCSEIWPLSDRQLMHSKLPKHCRSNFFLSGSRWSIALKTENQIAFSYINIGAEAARIELPIWLFRQKEMLELSLSAVISQVRRGQGYPLSLSEAHNLAVIKQSDRSRFFQLLSREMVRKHQLSVSVSPKESKKRRGFI